MSRLQSQRRCKTEERHPVPKLNQRERALVRVDRVTRLLPELMGLQAALMLTVSESNNSPDGSIVDKEQHQITDIARALSATIQRVRDFEGI